ncbi:hypothetical protein BLNAU_6720 [Blattamonas nauphoetae]|uniref:Uncharacterized protein n=1 Tax=Blattamonas nauphoetae TaxID=2049346 RepID=A0ABQ9Y3B9_9EUKA|nr:hypothetical protein BLNAU_6720 [Blattamonas nauphoetae]
MFCPPSPKEPQSDGYDAYHSLSPDCDTLSQSFDSDLPSPDSCLSPCSPFRGSPEHERNVSSQLDILHTISTPPSTHFPGSSPSSPKHSPSTDRSQMRAQLRAISVNNMPFVEVPKKDSFVVLNGKSLRIEITDVIAPVGRDVHDILKTFDHTPHSDKCFLEHQIKDDGKSIQRSFITTKLFLITDHNTDNLPTHDFAGNTLALLKLQVQPGKDGGVTMKEAASQHRTSANRGQAHPIFTFADRIRRLLKPEQNIIQEETTSISLLIEKETEPLSAWVTALSKRLHDQSK